MRNLKRVLALAMAMVMILGMMVIGSSAASYSDKAAIDEDYAEAVEVLSGMGVFKGTGAGFAPKAILTRAEAAALIYRVITGDVNDKQIDNYDYASLNDVKAGQWFTGYVTYANNGGYIKGDDLGNFNPNAQVTGIQVMAIMLRAAGYGQNGEYEGAAWKDNILTDAKELGITGTISTATLNAPASREVVAQLIWNAINSVDMVTYTPALGYIPVNLVSGSGRVNLAEKVFDLAETDGVDQWGRPSTIWYADNKTADGKYNSAKETKYAEIAAEPDAVYTVEIFECDIAEELGLKKDTTISSWWTNGVEDTTPANNEIEPIFVGRNKIGAQGLLTELYAENDGTYRVVQIDTYLATVTDVTECTYDKNDHLKEEANLDLDVWYDAYVADPMNLTSKTNFEYEIGDMLLVHYNEKTGKVVIEGYADSMVGAQSAYTTDPVHIVDDVEYPDAVNFLHDETLKVKTAEYTWYFDQYGNLIGAFEIIGNTSYGTITSIYWKDSYAGEDGQAIATITYMDGTSETATVAKIVYADDTSATLKGVEGVNADYANGLVSSTKSYNTEANTYAVSDPDYTNVALYAISSSKDGLVLTEVEVLNDATIATGVPAMKDTDGMKAGTSTQYLVYNSKTKTYTTYTGIKNIPTYKGLVDGWYVDAKNDGVADYIFLVDPVEIDAEKTVTYYWEGKLTVKTVLKKTGGDDYYVISGGYVNGEKATLSVKATNASFVTDIYNNEGTLLTVELVNDYVADYTGDAEAVNVVTDSADTFKIDNVTYYAVYAGAATAADLTDDVLTADGEAYYVDGLDNVITYNKNLAQSIKYDTNAYLYIVYTQSAKGIKSAQVVYITDVPGTLTLTLAAAQANAVAAIEEALTAAGVDVTDNTTVVTGYGISAKAIVDTWTAGINALTTIDDVTAYEANALSQVDAIATGYKAAKDAAADAEAEGKQVLVSGQAMSLADAVANSAAGSIIVLNADIDVDTAIVVNKDLAINLNGKTLTCTEDTVGDGVFHVTAGTLTISGEGTINGVGKSAWCMAIWADGGNVVINGGTYTNVGANTDPGSTQYDLIYAGNGSTITINGGTFECETPKWTLNCKDGNGTIVVNGGTFKNYNPGASYTEPTQPTSFLGSGKTVSEEVVGGNVWYTVK